MLPLFRGIFCCRHLTQHQTQRVNMSIMTYKAEEANPFSEIGLLTKQIQLFKCYGFFLGAGLPFSAPPPASF